MSGPKILGVVRYLIPSNDEPCCRNQIHDSRNLLFVMANACVGIDKGNAHHPTIGHITW